MTDASSVVIAGWLTKSSTNKQLWGSGWRRLWFVLRSTGYIPGQFLLQYYSNDDCRKLKGSIDLDELEQVDAGLTLRPESSKKSYPHIFDIKTKNKDYYFATDSEEEMNSWVKSLCTVCRLTLASSPDDVPTSGPVDYRYLPQPTPSRSSVSVTVVPSSSSSIENNNTPHFEERVRSDRPSKLPSSASVVVHHQKEASISSIESSGPYIPISECHSGNPNETRASESEVKTASSAVAIGNASVNKNVILADELYDFPKSSSSSSPPAHDSSVKSIHPGKDESGNNNWSNFSPCKDDISRASVRSCSALESSKSNPPLNRDSRGSQSFHARGRGASNAPIKESSNLYTNGNNNCSNITNECNVLPGREPPPRPPKPATLRRSKSKSQSSSSLGVNNNESLDDQVQCMQSVPQAPIVTVSQVDESYDMPKSCTGGGVSNNKETIFVDLDQVVPPSQPTVYVRGKLDSVNNISPRSSGTKLPDVTVAEMYDFPRSVEANTSPTATAVSKETVIDLNATVPMPSLSKKDIGGKHSYTNAASGFMSTKESVFNYDYKPSLPVTSDDASCTLSPLSEISHSSSVPERSPRTPNSAFSPSNDLTPPAVDRKFKPRKNRDSSSTASPTTPHPFPLSPAPATARKSNRCTSTLPSSKSFKNKNGQHSHDSVVRSCNTLGHRGSSAIAGGHLRAHSISEDEPSAAAGRKDENAHSPRKQKQIIEKPELQYLDLDLNDSDNSSPRTPNLILMEGNYHVPSMTHHKNAITPPMKERNATATSVCTATTVPPPPTTPKSTVYKTVDFVKTDALNKLRHTLDQTGNRI